MSFLRALAACLVIALLFGRATAEDAPFERVEYRRQSAVPADVAAVAIVSAREAEITRDDATVTRCKWTLVRGPLLRVVAPDGRTRLFHIGRDALTDVETSGTFTVGAPVPAWHAAALSDPAKQAAFDTFTGPGGETFFLHDDGTADWRAEGRGLVAVLRERTDEATLVLVLPGGTTRNFVRDGAHWRDRDSGVVFQSGRMRDDRNACRLRLVQLATAFVIEAVEKPGRPRYDGTALLLWWRKKRTIIPSGKEEVLRCPGDPHLRPLDDAARKAYDDVDLLDPPDDLCSYAARDFTNFPLPAERRDREILFCCRQGRDGRTPHHPDGICVAYDDGGVSFLTKEQLGLAEDDTIVVGPESKHPGLRKMLHIRRTR